MVDYTSNKQDRDLPGYYNLDLFESSALASLGRRESAKTFDLMIVDPAAQGLCGTGRVGGRKFKPKHLIYVSCNAATLIRDLKSLQGKFTITDTSLIDLFPATHHFETMLRMYSGTTRKKLLLMPE